MRQLWDEHGIESLCCVSFAVLSGGVMAVLSAIEIFQRVMNF